MPNPFEDDTKSYLALVNAEGQYSLWPSYVDMPEGWEATHGPASRASCLEHINEHWVDMRPNSLIQAMAEDSAART
jgi:uncharacterized protein YbdZ (MbtH family)